jgi:hypothetical protein
MEVLKMEIEKYLNYELEDDNTKFGGISFVGETLQNFLDECEIDYNISFKKLNKILKSNGIKPIKES